MPAVPTKKKVYIHEGNVWVKVWPAGARQRLTSDGINRDPTLSPDGREVAFVKKTRGHKVSTGLGDEEANELWLVGWDGTKPRMLFRGRAGASGDVRHGIAALSSPRFSPDGRRIYVMGGAWATSGTVWIVNRDGSNPHFVIDANDLFVVPTGKYRGHLVVLRHTYFKEAGSAELLFLVRPDGHVVALIDALPRGARLSTPVTRWPHLRRAILSAIAAHPPDVWVGR